MKLMTRYPIIITIGAAILGFVAGQMIVTDPLIVGWVKANAPWLKYAVPAVCTAFVVLVGKGAQKRQEKSTSQP
jgi:predicted tellurium resistance membrane protein TerC